MRNEIIMELAILEGFDPKQLSANQKRFRHVLATTLEKILTRNKYKSRKVAIDKRFSTTIVDETPNHFEGSSEFELPRFIKYKASKQSSLEGLPAINLQTPMDQESNSKIEININELIPRKERRDIIKENFISVLDRKTVLKTIKEANKPLSSQNIPYLSSETNFSRSELHSFYTIYKALCHVTSQLYKVMEYSSLASPRCCRRSQ